MNKQRGFTLLEIMIALCVMAILSTLAIAGMNTILNNRKQIDVRLTQIGELQMANLMLQRDFSQMIDRPSVNDMGNKQPALQASTTDITFIRAGYVNPMNALHRSTLQKIEYTLAGSNLARNTYPVLDSAGKTTNSSRIILSNIKTLKFQYIDKVGFLHAQWPPQTQPPAAAADDPDEDSDSNNNANTNAMAADDTQDNKPKWPRFPSGIVVNLTLKGWGEAQFIIPLHAGDLEKIEKKAMLQQEGSSNANVPQ